MIEGHLGPVKRRKMMNLRQGIDIEISIRRGIRQVKRRMVQNSHFVGEIVVHDLVFEEVTGLSRRQGNLGGLIM